VNAMDAINRRAYEILNDDTHAPHETFDQRFEREGAEVDAYLARRARQRVVRKTFEQPLPRTTAMDDAAWEARFSRSFANHPLLRHINKVMNASDDELFENDKKLKAKIEQLEAEIAELRVEILRTHKTNKSDVTISGSITPIRGRDVA
jgi:hypothetical protein